MTGGVCAHTPRRPGAEDADREAARLVTGQTAQGWSVNCTFLESLGTAMSDCPRSSV
ncbi:DUF5999 family protein [Streptomyces jumonjinensis]|uniref:DUF5999 family protein n=1 Tax=Streptomyces jumonjinensis TaxID=1945 RepID=UPI0037B6A795